VSDIAHVHRAAQPLLIAFGALIPVIVLTIILYMLVAASLARRDTGHSGLPIAGNQLAATN
jgi:hypothetical protein